jgi:hypothetical protein
VSPPTPAANGTITNGGCSCALPGSPRSGGVGWLLFGAALLSLRGLRRRAV